MSLKRKNQTANPISLFPFLAVLICTMGTLILLLIVIARNAKAQHLAENGAKETRKVIDDIELETGMTGAVTESLLESRNLTAKQIEEERGKIAVLEKQAEKLTAGIDQTLKFLESRKTDASDDELAPLRETLRRKQSERETLEAEYEKLREEYAGGKRSYAIVPYRGPNGTFKRPIYIECTEDKIIVQPEGIVFTEMDFIAASHPDNPLDAAVRAAFQYYTGHGAVEPGLEPYPLIIVRPGGIDAYYAVREALRSWNDNFGYELVDGDWKLQFFEPNQELKTEMVKQVDTARLRMRPIVDLAIEQLMIKEGHERSGIARNMGRNGGGSSGGFVGGYSGGFDGGTPGGFTGGPSGGVEPGGLMTGNGNVIGNGGPGTFAETSAGGVAGGAANYGFASLPMQGEAPQNFSGNHAATGFSEADSGFYGETGAFVGAGQASGQQNSQQLQPSPQNSPANNLFVRAEPQNEQKESGSSSGRLTNEQIWGSRMLAQSGDPAPPYADDYMQAQRRPFQRLPQQETSDSPKKKDNWAMPNAGNSMTAIARNIPLTCYPDKLVFTRSGGKGIDRELPTPQGVRGVSDTFATSIWDYIDTWGEAGSRMYWRPTLKVTVAPGAENQFEELKTMLLGSGMKVERQ